MFWSFCIILFVFLCFVCFVAWGCCVVAAKSDRDLEDFIEAKKRKDG